MDGNDADEIEQAYGAGLAACMDILERRDFYGVIAEDGFANFSPRLALSRESRLLELGAGIGGPARYFARRFGCEVVALDISPLNCEIGQIRTGAAGLEKRVEFICGDALKVEFPAASFTHVFASEALCYFPDKARAFERAKHWLVPGGRFAFLEAACDKPVTLRTADLIGPVVYESLAAYEATLVQAGFREILRFDTTEFAVTAVSNGIKRLLARREAVLAASGEEVYYGLLEIWAEFLALFVSGELTHCGFIATRPQ